MWKVEADAKAEPKAWLGRYHVASMYDARGLIFMLLRVFRSFRRAAGMCHEQFLPYADPLGPRRP